MSMPGEAYGPRGCRREMGGLAVPHKRATAPLGEAARARLWGSAIAGSGCGGSSGSGSGSDLSPGGCSPELADLVDSFYGDEGDTDLEEDPARRWRRVEQGAGGCGLAGEVEFLEGLVSVGCRDRAGSRIMAEAEPAWQSIAADIEKAEVEGSRGLKRLLVRRLLERGFDAGLCKAQCDKTRGGMPAAAHEYVDVVADGGARYIVEPDLAAEFEIARPTPRYRALLGLLPAVFVGSPDALGDVVRVMCAAAAASMRTREMHVPPWRRREYVQGKWLGPYRRTTAAGEPKGGAAPAESPGRAVAPTGLVGCQKSRYYRRVDDGWKGRRLAVGL